MSAARSVPACLGSSFLSQEKKNDYCAALLPLGRDVVEEPSSLEEPPKFYRLERGPALSVEELERRRAELQSKRLKATSLEYSTTLFAAIMTAIAVSAAFIKDGLPEFMKGHSVPSLAVTVMLVSVAAGIAGMLLDLPDRLRRVVRMKDEFRSKDQHDE